MNSETALHVDLPGYAVYQLLPEDSASIQELWEKCLDFMLLVDGRPARPNAAIEAFQDVPPGRSPDDLFIFGILNPQQELVGILESLRSYPDESTWWIGLLLLIPEVRSKGLGEKVVQGFVEFVRQHAGTAIMLGVVEENRAAEMFWKRMGFEFLRQTEPRQFGEKIHRVIVMLRQV